MTEFVSGSTLLTTTIGGTVLTILISVIKPCLIKRGYNPQVFVLAFGLFLGVVYTAFSYFVPEIYKTAVINFIIESISTAVFIYEFIWKNWIKFNNKNDETDTPQV